MKTLMLKLLTALLVIGVLATDTQAQQIPPIREGPGFIDASISSNRLSMVDRSVDNTLIISRDPTFDSFGPGIVGQVSFQNQPDGFDLIYNFTNTGTQPAQLGRLTVGKFNLGNNIQYRDFRHVGELTTVDYNTYAFQAFCYPEGIYSPVWVLQNQDYAIGISLQYPVLQYKHDARVLLGSSPANAPPNEGDRGWFVEFRLANLGDEVPMGRLPWPGSMAPGEQRQYVVSVRVTKTPAEWMRTLTPYRDYFRSMYGGVQYTRDARPIRPVLMALNHLVSPTNPYGFDDFGNRRPDRYGFRPWADNIKAANQWSRVMLWTPTGLYNQHPEMNFPFQFTSRWQSDPHFATAFDENVGLASIKRAGMSLGLWWGRSVQVAREWNTAQWEPMDPNNPAHVQAAFAEMDLAVQAGATEVGLDTFSPGITPIWKILPWMERLRENYPTVKFNIEPMTCDILHRLGSTFIVGWTAGTVRQESDLNRLNNPFYLADLLVPGHESWGAMSYHIHRANNYPVTPELVQRDMERIASLGYVPLMLDDPPSPRGVQAAESWLTSMPVDVLRGSGWNLNYNQQSAHRGPDGRLVIINDGTAPPRPAPGPGGRVGGSVPDRPGTTTPPAAPPTSTPPQATATETTSAPTATSTVMPDKRTTVTRKLRRPIDMRVHGADSPDTVMTAQPIPSVDELPGARNAISLPDNTGGKGGKNGPSSAWLEYMLKSGLIDKNKLNQQINSLRPGGVSGTSKKK